MICTYKVFYLAKSEPFELARAFVVYRDSSDRKCSEEQWAKVHCVASFKFESEANDYAAYRNEMMAKYGTDAVQAIKRPNDEGCAACWQTPKETRT